MTRRALVAIAVAIPLGLAIDAVVGYSTPGYPAAVGLGGSVLVIVVSKSLGKVWLQRPSDYYERAAAEEGAGDA